jgi:hypothetical protein
VHVDSRLHCSDIAISSWLGGQYGEEGQEGEEGGEKEEDLQEEDVGQRSLTRWHHSANRIVAHVGEDEGAQAQRCRQAPRRQKPTNEGVGEIEAHPSRIPAVGPT